MRVIAEFVDARNGKRYFPGDGDKIDPPLADDQAARLKKSGCLADGDEPVRNDEGKAVPDELPALPAEKDLRKMSAAQLTVMAAQRKVDIGSKTKAADIITILLASAKPAASALAADALPTDDVLNGMTLEQLDELARGRSVDVSACQTVDEAIAVLKASVQ